MPRHEDAYYPTPESVGSHTDDPPESGFDSSQRAGSAGVPSEPGHSTRSKTGGARGREKVAQTGPEMDASEESGDELVRRVAHCLARHKATQRGSRRIRTLLIGLLILVVAAAGVLLWAMIEGKVVINRPLRRTSAADTLPMESVTLDLLEGVDSPS
jgi:hypothetical protein